MATKSFEICQIFSRCRFHFFFRRTFNFLRQFRSIFSAFISNSFNKILPIHVVSVLCFRMVLPDS